MALSSKIKILGAACALIVLIFLALNFNSFFGDKHKTTMHPSIGKDGSASGGNLSITVFGYDGKIIKRWTKVQRVVPSSEGKNYMYFYTKDGRYVQLPNSVWYLVEEE